MKNQKGFGFLAFAVIAAVFLTGALYPFNPLKTTNPIQTEVAGTLGNQAFIAQVTYTTPAAASASYVCTAGSGSARTIVAASMTAQPDHARTLSFVANAATSATVTVIGTDIAGTAISEVVTLNATTTVYTTYAFKTVTSFNVPASKIITVGITDKLGLPYKGLYLYAIATYLNDTIEGTAATLTKNATLGKCLIDLNSALNGTDVDVFLIW